MKFKYDNHLAYSCGNGLEYQVSISYLPNSIAAGHRSCSTSCDEPGLIFEGEWAKFGFVIERSCFAAFSRTSLYSSASFCVTPGGSGGFSVLRNERRKKI